MDLLRAGMQYEFGRTGPPEGFPQLPVIPAGRYTDPTFLELEMSAMWKRSWVYACHLDEIPEPGHFLLFTRLGSPVLIIHGKDGVVRAFYNTCAHRGAPLVQTPGGKVEGLVCQYHGWTYGLDGRLVNLRDKRDFVGLDLNCHSLAPVRCFSWRRLRCGQCAFASITNHVPSRARVSFNRYAAGGHCCDQIALYLRSLLVSLSWAGCTCRSTP